MHKEMMVVLISESKMIVHDPNGISKLTNTSNLDVIYFGIKVL